MKLTGLYAWIHRRDTASESEPAAEWTPSGPVPEDLDLEKRWLQLVRIDAEQFRRFYDKYHDHLYRYLELRTGDAEVAQDLTQDVFIYALEHLDRFTWQGRSFGVWLFHIARRRVLPRHWRSGRSRSEAEYVRRQSAERDCALPIDMVERSELNARVRGLLQRFEDDRHDVFVLRVLMEYSLDDTAKAMEVPLETVRSHLRRGRAQLAGWLRDEQALTAEERRCLGEVLAREQGLTVVAATRRPRALRRRSAGGSVGDPRQERDEEHET
jgi:RNA polymerase sigma-70 factor, ECF subfamily